MEKEISRHAAAAKAIRQDLKKAFGIVKFEVRSQAYSGGTSVRVDWVDGPTTEQVREIVGKYQYGGYNWMGDIYENTNSRIDLPQVKFVQWQREISEKTKKECFEELQKTHAGFELVKDIWECSAELMKKWSVWTAGEYVHRILYKQDLTNGYQGIAY